MFMCMCVCVCTCSDMCVLRAQRDKQCESVSVCKYMQCVCVVCVVCVLCVCVCVCVCVYVCVCVCVCVHVCVCVCQLYSYLLSHYFGANKQLFTQICRISTRNTTDFLTSKASMLQLHSYILQLCIVQINHSYTNSGLYLNFYCVRQCSYSSI